MLIVFFTAVSIHAQSTEDKVKFSKTISRLHFEKDETKKAENLLWTANYCLDRPGNYKKDLDSAALLNRQSLKISKQLNLKSNIAQSMLLDGKIAKERGNATLAGKLKQKALDYAIAQDLKKDMAEAYTSIGLDYDGSNLERNTGDLLKAASLYRELGSFKEEAETFTNLSIIYNSAYQPATSIKYASQAIKIKKSIKENNFFSEYTMLALNLRIQGKYNTALSYALAAEKIIDKASDKQWQTVLINLIGTIYSELKYHDKSVEYYKKAITLAKENKDVEGVTSITINTVRGLYSRGKYNEALEILNNGAKYSPNDYCNIEYPSLYILLYCELKKYEKAKPYFEQLLKCSEQQNNNHLAVEKMYYAMIHYLLKTGQAQKAYTYIDELKKLSVVNDDLYNRSQLERTHFEVDSANGNFKDAIQHLKNFKRLNDSIFNINSSKQYADLQLKYETEKKDENIKLLTHKNELQEVKIKTEKVIRYIFIGSLIVLCIILGLLYSRYCMKRKTNAILEAKQEEINTQNRKLQRLVDEKEWLVKEIHHRVKNNLQIVISLLNTQSAYLDNDDALEAIQNSQHRMHAMSLIHQKLYQTDNLSSINMSWYIKELAEYLKDSFDDDDKIKFKLKLSEIELDVAQAVPLGLILNEAISNAIKYAFPEHKGIINILFEEKDEHYLLRIEDNGIGLPENFESNESDSLGMNLMMGLAEQLDGTFSIESDKGVIITINFIKRETTL
ncbi:tetratricopeptide repeat-containing sensor histidine kinase [Flavobacterium suzhouense]|uniref:histidine kinase n=1 Tax=Flavobacterium suzhouense TaxID=1529638 RepID=A0ABW5NUM9_9FLAO